MFALSDVDPGEGGESDAGILVLVPFPPPPPPPEKKKTKKYPNSIKIWSFY